MRPSTACLKGSVTAIFTYWHIGKQHRAPFAQALACVSFPELGHGMSDSPRSLLPPSRLLANRAPARGIEGFKQFVESLKCRRHAVLQAHANGFLNVLRRGVEDGCGHQGVLARFLK